MSLSQASSHEEVKRELKLQTFLAIQGKYPLSKTDDLIKDMDIIANAIADNGEAKADEYEKGAAISKAIMAQPYNSEACAGKNATKVFMFQRTGERLPHSVEIDGNGRPIPDSVQVQGITYYRHVLGIKADSSYCDYWFYSIAKSIDSWTNDAKFDTWQECRDFDIKHSKDDYVPATTKPHIFIGGRHDSDTRQLTVDSEFKPHKESIGLIIPSGNIPNGRSAITEGTTTVYYRHHLTVVTGGWSVTRWFYCDEKNIDSWTEQKLLSTLDRINKFFVDNMEDPMNTAK